MRCEVTLLWYTGHADWADGRAPAPPVSVAGRGGRVALGVARGVAGGRVAVRAGRAAGRGGSDAAVGRGGASPDEFCYS